MTDNQWIMQNIIDLKSDNALLRNKLKKYKKRLNELYIEAEDDEISQPRQLESIPETPEDSQAQPETQHEDCDPKPIKISRHDLRRR